MFFYRNKSSLNLHCKKNRKFNFRAPNNLLIKRPLLTKENNIYLKNPLHSYNFAINKTNNESQASTSICNNDILETKDKKDFYRNMNKYKKIVLPSLPSLPSLHNNNNNIDVFPTLILDSKNINNNINEYKEKKEKSASPKKIKLKKIKIKKNGRYLKGDTSLIKLYKENYQKKRQFEQFREKYNDLTNFSLLNYNIELIRLSSIRLSKDSCDIFKKNMRFIELGMKGIKINRKNRWINFLDKIETIAPEGLKNKIINLSLSKDIEGQENI